MLTRRKPGRKRVQVEQQKGVRPRTHVEEQGRALWAPLEIQILRAPSVAVGQSTHTSWKTDCSLAWKEKKKQLQQEAEKKNQWSGWRYNIFNTSWRENESNCSCTTVSNWNLHLHTQMLNASSRRTIWCAFYHSLKDITHKKYYMTKIFMVVLQLARTTHIKALPY